MEFPSFLTLIFKKPSSSCTLTVMALAGCGKKTRWDVTPEQI
jgi:hypothetical protein